MVPWAVEKHATNEVIPRMNRMICSIGVPNFLSSHRIKPPRERNGEANKREDCEKKAKQRKKSCNARVQVTFDNFVFD